MFRDWQGLFVCFLFFQGCLGSLRFFQVFLKDCLVCWGCLGICRDFYKLTFFFFQGMCKDV